MNNEEIINISMEVEDARKGHETVGKRLDNFDSQLDEITTNVEKIHNDFYNVKVIDLKNEENKNDIHFTVTDIEDDNAIVQSASENQLVLRQINSGDKIEFKAKISAVKNISIERLNQISLITLKGLYIDAKGKETPIEKEIKMIFAEEIKMLKDLYSELSRYKS